jgi:hypothetical protein
MILIVERGQEEKNVSGDFRRVRTAKFGYRLPSKRTLGQRAPTRRRGESREFLFFLEGAREGGKKTVGMPPTAACCSIHLEQGVYQRLFLFHATLTLAL